MMNLVNKSTSKSTELMQNTLFLILGQFINKGLQFVMIPLFSRWLKMEDYGTFDLLSTYISLLLPVLTLSIGEAVFRLSVEDDEKRKKIQYITSGLVYTFFNFLVFAIILIIAGSYGWIDFTIPFLWLLSGQLLNYYLQGCIRALKKLSIYSFCNAFSTLVIAVSVTIFVLYMNMGLEGMIYGYAIGYYLGNILIIIKTRLWSYLSLKEVSQVALKKMIRYSSPLVFNDISWWVLNVSDRQVINIFLGASYNGIYAISNKIPALCTAVFSMFGLSWQQEVTEKINDGDRDIYFNQVFNQLLKTLVSLCIFIVAINFLFFKYIFAAKYADGAKYVPILLTATIFSSIMLFYGTIQIGLKRTKENGISTFLGAIVNVLVDLILIRYVGLYAAALSTLVANMFTAFVRKHRLKGIVSFKLEKTVIVCVVIYLYVCICEYICVLPIGIKITNILLALICIFFYNQNLISKLKKMRLRKA